MKFGIVIVAALFVLGVEAGRSKSFKTSPYVSRNTEIVLVDVFYS